MQANKQANSVLLLGGTPHVRGGVEIFSERATLALRQYGLDVVHLPTNTAFLRPNRFPALISSYLASCRAVLRAKNVWLQYGNFFDLFYLALGLLPGVRIIVTPHLGSNWRSQQRDLLRAIAKLLLARADAIALLSGTQQEELDLPETVGKAHVRTFLPSALFQLKSVKQEPAGDEPLKLIHAGRLSSGKGTIKILDIARKLQTANVPFALSLVGTPDPQARSAIDAALSNTSLAAHLHFIGQVDERTLLKRLSEADILLHLSEVDSFPLIVLEALGCGAYPICLSLAGARNMTETYAGTVLSSDDPVGECAALLAGIDRNNLRAKTAKAAASLRSDYSWISASAAIAHVLEVRPHPNVSGH